MKACTTCKVTKSDDQFYFKRGKLASQCKSCHYLGTRRYAVKNKEACYRRTREWRAKSGDAIKAYCAKKYAENPEFYKYLSVAWRKANKAKMLASNARQRAVRLRAMVSWADETRIFEMYDRASRVSKCTGFVWHVDHIVPLQGKTVCGLHVPDNLRVIPAKINLKKHNSWVPI